MFCDLIGSTALSLRLDPEAMHDLIQVYRRTVERVLVSWGGVIASFLGDGLLIYFGYPRAHEDDARRALGAALEVQVAVAALGPADLPASVDALRVHIGIHTGLVVVGDFGPDTARETSGIVGSVPYVAARLQALAGPGETLVSGATAALAAPHFQTEFRGSPDLRGIEGPIEVFRVVAALPGAQRFRGAPDPGTFVGRRDELATVHRLWRAVQGGRGQVLIVEGDSGVGKSRFVRETLLAIRGESGPSLDVPMFQCEEQARNTPFFPLIARIGKDVGLANAATAEKRLELLRAAARDRLGDEAAADDLARLLGVEPVDSSVADTMSPQVLRRRLVGRILDWLLQPAAAGPTVAVIEDLHWADHSTLELLALLAERVADAPMLLVLTQRPTGNLAGLERGHRTRLELQPLAREDARALIQPLLEQVDLPAAKIENILEKGTGIPLYLEELAKAAQRADPGDNTPAGPADLSTPVPLRDPLMARLDEVGPAKQLLQTAAVIGPAFSLKALAQIGEFDDRRGWPMLATLVAAGLLVQSGATPSADFQFQHVLVQEFAYQTLLIRERVRLHARVADFLAAEGGDQASLPAIIARHYAEANEPLKAANFWLMAGRHSIRNSANREAEQQLREGLKVLATATSARESLELELQLRMTLTPALIARFAWSSPEVETNLLRARGVADAFNDDAKTFDTLRNLFNLYLLRADMAPAADISAKLMQTAMEAENGDLLLEAQRTRGLHRFYVGDLAGAQTDLRAMMQLYDPAVHRLHAFRYGVEPAVVAKLFLAWSAVLEGHEVAAFAELEEALHLAHESEHPFSTGYAYCLAASVNQGAGRVAAAGTFAERAVAIAQEHAFPYWLGWGQILSGWARGAAGDPSAGRQQLAAGLDVYAGTGAKLIVGYALVLRAELERIDGDHAVASATLAEARSAMTSSGVAFYQRAADA